MRPEESIPEHIKRPPESITLWVIYDHPRDFPDLWVLRPQFSARRKRPGDNFSQFGRITEDYGKAVVVISPLAWFAPDIGELHAILPPGCFQIGRNPGDDPAIAEIWMDPAT